MQAITPVLLDNLKMFGRDIISGHVEVSRARRATLAFFFFFFFFLVLILVSAQ